MNANVRRILISTVPGLPSEMLPNLIDDNLPINKNAAAAAISESVLNHADQSTRTASTEATSTGFIPRNDFSPLEFLNGAAYEFVNYFSPRIPHRRWRRCRYRGLPRQAILPIHLGIKDIEFFNRHAFLQQSLWNRT